MSEFLGHDLLAHAESNQSFSSKDAPIQLRVGQCHFTAWQNTLTDESTFFAAMFSGRWDNYTDCDGAVFIDADGSAFKDVLAYLRTGNFPLFFDAASKSFDYARYQTLLGEAKFFGISRLEQWIEEQRYQGAIEMRHQTQTFDSEQEFAKYVSEAIGNILHCSSSWRTKKVYICPREIPVHRDRPSKCGQQCGKARQGEPPAFEYNPCFNGMIVTNSYTWKPEVCLGENFTAGSRAEEDGS